MRLSSLALALAALVPARTHAQADDWELQTASPFNTYRFEDASFLDPQHGWIVSGVGGGDTWRTQDGGATWEHMSTVSQYLRSAAFVSPTHGFIGAIYGPARLYETTDAGATLVDVTSRITPAIGGGICGLWALDADHLFGVGQWNGPAYIIRTNDGGATWTSTDLTSIAGSLIDVVFLDAQRGYIVGGDRPATQGGGRVVILATEDGGTTWTRRFTGSAPAAQQGEWAWKVSFPSVDVGYVSVEQYGNTSTGKVIKTTDGGQTWTEILISGAGSLQGLGFINTQRGWISGRGQARQTTDGGVTWTPITTIDGNVNRFEFFGGTRGYAMGTRIYSIDLTTTDAETPPARAATLDPVAPNPARGGAMLRYTVETAGAVDLAVYDMLGRRVAVLAQGPSAAGAFEVRWDGRDQSGRPAESGVYALRLQAAGQEATQLFAFTP